MIRHANRTKSWRLVLALALALAFVSPARADYEAGQRALEAGRLDAALSQWRAAADAGDRRAMLVLGQRYRQGLGVPQDYVEAHKWLNLAASRGEAAALKERDALAAKMTPAKIATAQELARAWRPDAGQAGEATEAARSPSATAISTPTADAGSPPPRAIREAQTLLAALGYRPGPADGIWGRRTAGAYRAFLLDAGLPAAKMLTPEALRAMRAIAKRGDAATETERSTALAADAAQTPSAASAPRPAPVRPDALHRAAQAGDIDGLQAAIAAGVDVDARDGRGWTALMHAVNKGYTLLVPRLLEAKAEVDVRAPDGATALFMAAVHGHTEIFSQLMQAGADASIPGPQGRTPLDVAQLKEGSRILALPEVVALLGAEKERKEREEARQRAEADSGAFSRAKSLNTPQAYKDYLSVWCPAGNFCGTARTRIDDLVRERISGKIFSGPLQNPHYDRLTLRFHPSGQFKAHYHAWLGGAWHSGTWRVENGKVRLRIPDGIIESGSFGTAEIDGNVLRGRLANDSGYAVTWRLTEVSADDSATKRKPKRYDDSDRR